MFHYNEDYCAKCIHLRSNYGKHTCDLNAINCYYSGRKLFKEASEELLDARKEADDILAEKRDTNDKVYVMGTVVGVILLSFMIISQLIVVIYAAYTALSNPTLTLTQVLINTWNKLYIIIIVYVLIQLLAFILKTKHKLYKK